MLLHHHSHDEFVNTGYVAPSTLSPLYLDRVFRLKSKNFLQFHYIHKKGFGSREEDAVASFLVFSHVRMRGYFRLGKGE